MLIQELGGGAFVGFAIGMLICSPTWALKVFTGRIDGGTPVAALWGIIAFISLCVFWWSAIFEQSAFSFAAAACCTVIWWWKTSTNNL